MYFGFVLSYAINVNVTNLGLGIVVDKPDDVRGSVFKDFLDEGFDDGVNWLFEVGSDLFAFLRFFFHLNNDYNIGEEFIYS